METLFNNRKIVSILIAGLLALGNLSYIHAQSAANYTPVRSTGISFSSILSSGTAVASGTWRAASDDDSRTSGISIGFDFWYLGVKYTTFSISTNGYVDFSSATDDGSGTTAFGYDNTDFYGTSSTVLCLAPLYDDLEVPTRTSNASVAYSVSGSAPNRVLTVEWLSGLSASCADATCNTYNFQVKINESTGVVEYWYGSMTGDLSYNCGLNGPTVSATPTSAQYLNQTTANTATFGTGQAGLTTVPASNTKIVFTPPSSVAAPTSLNFTSVTQSAMTLNWTASSPTTNIIRYAIYNSTDNSTFTYITDVALGTNSYASSGLTASTTYYWKVYAVSEGALSTVLSNSQTTSAPPTITSNGTGDWNTAGTWVGGVVPTSTDNVQIADGHTITINASVSCYGLTVGQGTSGILQFEQTTARTLTVTTNVTIASGGTFQSNTAGTQTGHVLSVGGNITNNGTLDFSTNTNTAAAGVTFTGSSNTTFSGTGGTTDIKTITINKGTSSSSVLELSTTNFTVQGVTTDVAGFLTLTNGTLKISGSFTVTNRIFTAASYTIGSTTGLYLNNANFTVAGQAGTLTLAGLLQIDAGTYNVGLNASGQNLTISGTTSAFTINGGALNVYSRFTYGGDVVYTQTAGTVTVCTGVNSGAGTASFQLSSASTFNMSGGYIVLALPNSNGTPSSQVDYVNYATTRTVTGGTLQIGNSNSGAAKTFVGVGGYMPNLVITNTTGNHTCKFANYSGGTVYPTVLLTTTLQNNTTLDAGATWVASSVFTGNLTIGTGATLTVLNQPVTATANWENNGTFTSTTATVTFNGTTTQTISGSSTTTFYNLTTANSSVTTFSVPATISNSLTLGGTSTIDANAALNIDGAVTIAASTTFQEGANTHTIAGNWTDNGTFTEEGGTINFDGGTQTISGSSVNFNNFTHSGSGTTTLGAAVDINGNVSLTAGTFAQSTYNMTVAGNWTSTGNYFTEGTGTVTFDGTGTSTISGSTANVLSASSSTIYSDACESSTGWTLNGGTATWVLTTPTGTYSPTNDNSASGTQCFKTAAAGSAYANSKTYILTSPTIDLTGYSGTSLSFYLWMDAESTYDGGFIEIYNGTSWVSATGSVAYDGALVAGTYSGTSAWSTDRTSWTLITVDISSCDGISSFQIRFKFGSDGSNVGGGFAVDDITVTGSTSTTITGEAFKKYEVNKTGGGYVQLSSDTWASTNFTLTSGTIRTGAYTLILGNVGANATISGGSSSAYIVAYDNSGTIGYVKQYLNSNTSYSFPIGDASNYTPYTFTLTSATLSNAYLTTYTKATKVTGLNSSITQYVNRFWDVTPSGITSPTYTIAYTYVDGDIVGSETGMLPIKKSGTTWYKPVGSSFSTGTEQGTGSLNAGTNTLTWSSLTSFSLIGGAVDGAVPLPIELTSFIGHKDGKNNVLLWNTSTEQNNDFFTIEKTTDGENFEIVGTENGAGNSTQYLEYSLTDYNVREVINYYRLKQTDFDGKYTFSDVISIDNRTNTSNKEIVMITNILGQEVNEHYRGVVIIVYADGTSIKVIQ